MEGFHEIIVNMCLDDFIYRELIEFCDKNSIELETFFKILVIRYLVNNGGLKL